MNEYWKHQHGLTHDEKRAFVAREQAEEAKFLQSLRKITSGAENRMLTRTAKEQHRDALRELNRGPDDVSSIQRGMLK